ncbi:hypothetical protein, partial [Leuconostoc mesenteroides]
MKAVTQLSDIERQFLSALPDGRDNAVTLLKLSRTLHINKHKVSEIVARLRNAGYLVGSSKSRPNGVYFIITAQEFWETVNTINKSIQSQQATNYLKNQLFFLKRLSNELDSETKAGAMVDMQIP